jgi:hypothetical protein
MFRSGTLGQLALLGLLALAAVPVGCGGGEGAGDVTVATAGADLPKELLDQSWPMEYALNDAQDKLIASSEGWVPLLAERNYKTAAKKFGATGGIHAARGHAEAAALYRQGALTAAWSFIETYGKTPQDTDPLGTAHLLAVSYALVGDLENAKLQSARLDAAPADPTTAWHAPWKAWIASGAAWPPDLSSLPLGLPEPAAGEWPELPPPPHYTLAEQGGSTSVLDMADPGALVALALWHDRTARAAAGDQAAAIDTYGARYYLPVEPRPTLTALPVELRFASDYLVPEDGPFVAALTGKEGAAAVDAYKDKSLLAAMADRARVDGKLDAERAIDMAAGLRAQLVDAARAKANNADDAEHRMFADVAQAGALRVLALVAEAEGDRTVSGILRINAMEKSSDWTTCPTGLLSLAAWDASNRYPARGSEILHQQTRRYPSLETARYGLDVLALRVSREGARLPPGM